jgi:hypothetical protein
MEHEEEYNALLMSYDLAPPPPALLRVQKRPPVTKGDGVGAMSLCRMGEGEVLAK